MRDGQHTVADLMTLGSTVLGRRHVLPSVPSTLRQIQVEGTFPSGTYLVTVHNPISTEDGDLARALYGSFLPIPSQNLFPAQDASAYAPKAQPGAVVVAKQMGPVVLNAGRKRVKIQVTSKGDRPIQVGSHYQFSETNAALSFDRIRAVGYRLDIPAGTSVRFEPGDTKTVTLVEIAGNKIVKGGNSLLSGQVGAHSEADMVTKLQASGFSHVLEPGADAALFTGIEAFKIERAAYCTMFGPTVGDKIRLGSTDLWIKVEMDMTVYGDECKFGGGKTLREGMGQASGRPDSETLDMVVTNALIVDWTGIYKADIGVKNGLIVGIGKAGNPDTMAGVDPRMIVGSCTDVIAGEGRIVTAGGMDSHIHFICPQQACEAIASGITTMLGGGTGPRSDWLHEFLDFEIFADLDTCFVVPAQQLQRVRPGRDTFARCSKLVTNYLSTLVSPARGTTAPLKPSETKWQRAPVALRSMRIGAPLRLRLIAAFPSATSKTFNASFTQTLLMNRALLRLQLPPSRVVLSTHITRKGQGVATLQTSSAS